MSDDLSRRFAGWEDVPARNLLLPSNLALVREALQNRDVVFGQHYYYAGGRSGDPFCFGDYESYHRAVLESRPGDHFTVYSRRLVLPKALQRVGEPRSTQPILGVDGLGEVREALAAGKEIVFLACWIEPESSRIRSEAGIIWDLTDEELREQLGLDKGRWGELLFFLVETLDEDEEGKPIGAVSPGARRRVNALVDGKRPNEAGMTPASGVY